MKNLTATGNEKFTDVKWTKRDFLEYLKLRRRLIETMRKSSDFKAAFDLPLIDLTAKAFVSCNTVERLIDKTSSDLDEFDGLMRLVVNLRNIGLKAMVTLGVTRAQRLKQARKKLGLAVIEGGETLEERLIRLQREHAAKEAKSGDDSPRTANPAQPD